MHHTFCSLCSRPLGFRRATLASAVLSLATIAAQPAWAAPEAQLTLSLDKPGAPISPLLYGIFFEEINRAGEGGIYAEMLQNRSFEDAAAPIGWAKLVGGAERTTVTLDTSQPLNAQNPTSLRIEIKPGGGRAGIANQGFTDITPRPNIRPADWKPETTRVPGGLAVQAGENYNVSL